MDIELAHEALAMSFDGTGADVQVAANFLVAETFGDAGQHLALTIRAVGRGWFTTRPTPAGSALLRPPTRSAFDFVIAHRLPALNQIVFLRASGSLTSGTIMDMDMRGAMRNGVIHRHVPLKPLVQIASLGDVNGNPITALNLFGINKIAWQRLETSLNGMNLILILVAGLATPTDQR